MASGVEFPPETRARFLAALAITGKISGNGGAAEAADVAVPTLYQWRNKDLEFAAAWDEAKSMRREILAEKGINAIEKVVEDANHRDHFAAAKFVVERGEPNRTPDRAEGADDDRIAEAIDRFTTLIGRLATRDVRQPHTDGTGAGSLNP